MGITVYGIPNCGSVKKTRDMLEQAGQAYAFHDFKKQGVSEALLNAWLKHVTWDRLLNRKGTTWRGLADDVKASVVDADTALRVMLNNPSTIKRPVIDAHGAITVGVPDSAPV